MDTTNQELSRTNSDQNGNNGGADSAIIEQIREGREQYANEQKRGRGRPKGSGNKTGNGSGNGNTKPNPKTAKRENPQEGVKISLSQEVKKIKKTSKKFLGEQEAQQTAQAIILVAETFVVSSFGEHAALNPVERALIESGLPKCLERLKVSTVDKLTGILAPGLLVAGLALYGFRNVDHYMRQNPEQPKKETQEAVKEELTEQWQNEQPVAQITKMDLIR